MATKTAMLSALLTIFPGFNNDILQTGGPFVLDVPVSMADNDDVKLTFDTEGDFGLPPVSVNVMRWTGGDLTNTVDDNWAVNAGDTIIFSVLRTNSTDQKSSELGVYKTFTHSLSGGTDGAYTNAQVVASINADTAINTWVYAVADLTANRVTLIPKTSTAKFSVIGGTANNVLIFPSGEASWAGRTYVSQSHSVIAGGTGWSWNYVASTRVLTITNETGGAVTRSTIFVMRR